MSPRVASLALWAAFLAVAWRLDLHEIHLSDRTRWTFTIGALVFAVAAWWRIRRGEHACADPAHAHDDGPGWFAVAVQSVPLVLVLCLGVTRMPPPSLPAAMPPLERRVSMTPLAASGSRVPPALRRVELPGDAPSWVPVQLDELTRPGALDAHPRIEVLVQSAGPQDGHPGTWWGQRQVMVCCAADAQAIWLLVEDPAQRPPPRRGAWVRVRGTWHPGESGQPMRLALDESIEAAEPRQPYLFQWRP